MNALTAFGLVAVTAMLICYALEARSAWWTLGFAGACLLGSAYGFAQGAWPFGLVEGVWALVAARRWWVGANIVTAFQQSSLLLTVIWLVIVAVWFRRSSIVLIGGLVGLGLYTAAAWALGQVTLDQLGLGVAQPWWRVIGLAAAWTGLMFAYSPVADRLASRWFAKPPTLGSFRAIQQSRVKLILGILVAWALGGVLEELVFRGIVVRAVETWLGAWLIAPVAAAFAIVVAALGAGLIHFYQGPRAMVIITQLSVLFGLLFVVSGHSLWTVMLCHGLYDTVAFIRFAAKKSKYSDLDAGKTPSPQSGT